MNKTKIALIAAAVLTASAALAQTGEEIQGSAYQLNPNAPVPLYGQAWRPAPLVEGRNVAIETRQEAVRQQADRFESFGGY